VLQKEFFSDCQVYRQQEILARSVKVVQLLRKVNRRLYSFTGG
jgi:hypothetical protein